MVERPMVSGPWVELWHAYGISTSERFTDPVPLATGIPGLVGGCLGLEVKLTATAWATSLTLKVYSCADAIAANRSHTAIPSFTWRAVVGLDTSDTFYIPALEVGSGLVFGAIRGAGMAFPTITLAYRHIVWRS